MLVASISTPGISPTLFWCGVNTRAAPYCTEQKNKPQKNQCEPDLCQIVFAINSYFQLDLLVTISYLFNTFL